MSAHRNNQPRNRFITINDQTLNVHLLKCMVRRLWDLNVYVWHEVDYILGWLQEFENGGAMPSEFWFRCPHGAQVKFLDCLLCIWRTFNNLEDDVHLVESDTELNETAEEWTNDHLQNEDIGGWDEDFSDYEREQYENHIEELLRHMENGGYPGLDDEEDETEEESI